MLAQYQKKNLVQDGHQNGISVVGNHGIVVWSIEEAARRPSVLPDSQAVGVGAKNNQESVSLRSMVPNGKSPSKDPLCVRAREV